MQPSALLLCNRCGKKGHIGSDCRSTEGKTRDRSKPKSKTKTGSIFATSLEAADEAVDNDTYDDDQDGFIIGSLGAFCAVTLDQSEELYIDKSDLI